MTVEKNVNNLIKKANKENAYRLLYNFGLRQFIRLDNMNSLKMKNSPVFVLLKDKQFFKQGSLHIDDNYIDLPIGRMYNLQCNDVNVGIIFEFPHFDCRILDNLISVIRPNFDLTNINDAEVVLRNKSIAVFAESDNLVTITINSPLYVNIKR